MPRISDQPTDLEGPLTSGRTRTKARDGLPRRLSSADRERSIVTAAVTFFAEHGFEGQTRELAAILGITQPLLYRYFPSKDALIERVYQEVFVGRWDPFWEQLIADRGIPLEERLIRFYQSYAKIILTPEWVRLFMFAGLKGLDFNGRYLRLLRERVFERIAEELRIALRRPSIADVPVSNLEIEMIWALHASIFYLGVRQFIYRLPIDGNVHDVIAAQVRTLLGGIAAVLPETP
ncbi:TetR/AcrR family transcriptional regulator [Methylobacterium sp. ID0610]|uniref:TetR/AcrR family transcriptional regulator n=1 Tax=Methylobacterium carpenticola TaxID=3344827 RepID=UPI0036AF21F0